ncbi:hypothetical protein NXH76_22995 [Blautia schinkii]|nr:hypothetical protein [Blautia schinkii]
MADVTIEELGLRFVQVCLKQYWGGCLFLVLFAAGVVWSLCCHRKKEAGIFIGYTIFLILTVYNPFFVKYIVPKVNFENEYYRFFWILPVVPGVAYYAVRLVFAVKNKWGKTIVALILAGVIVAVGTPIPGVTQNFAMADNLYKVPDDLRAVCSVIHEDSEKENPRVVFSNDLNTLARQYDASLQLVLNRNAVLYRAGSTVAGKINEKSSWYRRQRVIMDVVYYEQKVRLKKFRYALRKTRTDYLVLPVTLRNHKYFMKAGCEPIAQTNNYVVYRFDWKNANN